MSTDAVSAGAGPSRCLVCGVAGGPVRELELVSGRRLGLACREVCTGLLWESWFIRATGGEADAAALVLWKWRRRRAEVQGLPFTEEPPRSASELAFEVQFLMFHRGAA